MATTIPRRGASDVTSGNRFIQHLVDPSPCPEQINDKSSSVSTILEFPLQAVEIYFIDNLNEQSNLMSNIFVLKLILEIIN